MVEGSETAFLNKSDVLLLGKSSSKYGLFEKVAERVKPESRAFIAIGGKEYGHRPDDIRKVLLQQLSYPLWNGFVVIDDPQIDSGLPEDVKRILKIQSTGQRQSDPIFLAYSKDPGLLSLRPYIDFIPNGVVGSDIADSIARYSLDRINERKRH
ncbi:MAG: hypothetical protein ABII01_07075 [Candidatus Woesearchaeota archaeon]